MSSSRAAPGDCRDMSELRQAIDRIDAELIGLFAERMGYIHRAAELKKSVGIPAEVPDRVQEVVSNASALAAGHGLDPVLYGAIWSRIVEAAIAEEKVRLGEETPMAEGNAMAVQRLQVALGRLEAGDWAGAHAIVQDLHGPDAAWIHAHLHRVEGDLGNAAYWYRRAGRPVAEGGLDAERSAIVAALTVA